MRNISAPVERKSYVRPVRKKVLPPDGTEWRCPGCKQDLFGIFRDGKLHIKYKERDILADGVLVTHCRSCGCVSRINTRSVQVNIIQSADDTWMDRLKISATASASSLAVTYNLDLSNLNGSGQDGRILKGDVVRAYEERNIQSA